MKNLEKEAEENAKKHGFPERVTISRNAFIAGAKSNSAKEYWLNSNYVKSKVLQGQIDENKLIYQTLKDHLKITALFTIIRRMKYLKQQLKELEQ